MIDHVVWVVSNLDEAESRAREAGFTVTAGGRHPGGVTENALIPLADGAYIELLRFCQAPATIDLDVIDHPLARRFVPRARARTGLIDYAVAVDHVDRIVTGHPGAWQGPFRGERVKPDGTRLAWRMGFPQREDLPFLISDDTPRDQRVPGGVAGHHANGITGLAELRVRTSDPAGYRAALSFLSPSDLETITLINAPGPGVASVWLERADRHRVDLATLL